MYISSRFNYAIISKAIEIESNNIATEKKAFVIDWSQFIPTMIATFLAFCLTLFASYLYDKYKDSVQRSVFLHDIRNELKTMRDELKKINGILNDNTKSTSWMYPLKTYIWDSLIDNNMSYLISSEKWYGNLLAIYHMAKEYNSWHMLRTEIMVKGRVNSEIDRGITRLMEDLIKKIDIALQIM